jgi:putative ABC transport system substrate-binding protein
MGVFRQGLRERGWVEGQNLTIEERYPRGGDLARLPGLAAELVKLPVDIIVTSGNTSTASAQKATRTIPVVFSTSEPVERGFVASLARPGGNLTGFSGLAGELNAKRLEILREAFPQATRVGVLHRPSAGQRQWLKDMELAARRLGMKVIGVEVSDGDSIDRAADVLVRERVNALVPLASPFFNAEKERVVGLAARLRLPAIYPGRVFVEAGGLMYYGPDARDVLRRLAAHVDRILRGASPAEIPVEQATRIEFVLNEKTAKALGITFSSRLLNRADEVIK